MHLATTQSRGDIARSPALSDSVLTRYDVQRSDFDATLRYYSRRPAAFEALYDAVIDTLNALQQEKRGSPQASPDTSQQATP